MLAGAVAAITLSACGAQRAPVRRPSTSAAFATTPRLVRRPPASLNPPAVARPSPGVGAVQQVHAGTTTLAVRLLEVIDPLRSSGARLPPGDRAVGIVVQIRNVGSGGYDSSATGDIGLVGSGGPAVPVYAPRGVCQTPLRDFDNEIGPGELRQGCVVFALPSNQRPQSVRFSPHGAPAGSVSWRALG
jgi:hypothetical protein